MVDFSQKIDEIESKEDFIRIVNLLVVNLINNPEEWVNKTLPNYLEGISSWVEDMEGYYQNRGLPYPENINWKLLANVLVAAKMYE